MGFSQDSRVFFQLDKANLNISQLALKLENTKLISNAKFREEFLFYWTAVRVKIYLDVVKNCQLFDPKNIDLDTYDESDAKDNYERLEDHLVHYTSYDINPEFDTQEATGKGIHEYFILFDGRDLNSHLDTLNSKCFDNSLNSNDQRIMKEFLSISQNTFEKVIKNTKIVYN